MQRLLLLAPVLALTLTGFADAAPPKAKKGPAASRVFRGAPVDPGAVSDADATMPTEAARASAASSVAGGPVAIAAVWASVSPRRPKADDRAILVFANATIVDAKRGIASWGASMNAAAWQPPPPGSIDCLDGDGCSGTTEPDPRGLNLWVKGEASKRYYAECRVRFDLKKKGTLAVTAEGFDATFTVDHTGKSFARIGWVVDPSAAGWFQFALSSASAWSLYGCTVDALE
jgi:hypothetical protein